VLKEGRAVNLSKTKSKSKKKAARGKTNKSEERKGPDVKVEGQK
jgi:hypothetical protein